MQKLHYHYYDNNNPRLQGYSDAEFIKIESISIHVSYYNVDSQIGNNQLFYDTSILTPLTLSNGYWDLSSLNTHLRTTLSPDFYKIVIDTNSQGYSIYKYPDVASWANELNGVLQNVNTSSTLNMQIRSGTFFANILTAECNLFEARTTIQGTNNLDVHNEFELPITAPRMSYQTIYFNPPVMYKYSKTGDMNIRFLDYDGHKIRFNPLFTPLIVFGFE